MDASTIVDNLAQRPLFILTVDTEEEWDWNADFPTPPCSTNNIDELPKFQGLCNSVGVRPTYFIDYAIAEVDRHRETLSHFLDKEECDFGAHLHPWCNPPLVGTTTEHNSHAVNLPLSLFQRKMENLTSLLKDAFGAHPYSFRSGRWGINGPMLKILSELGYQVDSTVRPFYEDDGFEYHRARTRPYTPSFTDLLDADEQQTEILEIPTSSGFNHSAFEFLNRTHQLLSVDPLRRLRLIGILWQLGLLRKISMTPEDASVNDLKKCMDMCIKRGDGVINMFLHSSTILPGNSPYVRTKSDLEKLFSTIALCAEYARKKHNANFVTMREAGALLGFKPALATENRLSPSTAKDPECEF